MGVYELGSIFKVMTAAMAWKAERSGSTKPSIRARRWKLARQPSMMRMAKTPATPREIVIHSSNIGSVQLALRVSDVAHYDFMEKLGFTQRLQFELPETGAPLMPVRWTDIERATTSFGHGFSVTPLHALVAGAAMVNGGVLYPPRLTPTGHAGWNPCHIGADQSGFARHDARCRHHRYRQESQCAGI